MVAYLFVCCAHEGRPRRLHHGGSEVASGGDLDGEKKGLDVVLMQFSMWAERNLLGF